MNSLLTIGYNLWFYIKIFTLFDKKLKIRKIKNDQIELCSFKIKKVIRDFL